MSSSSSTTPSRSTVRSAGFHQAPVMKPSRVRWICSGLNRLVVVPAVVAATMILASTASAQLYTTSGSTGNWVSNRWSPNPSGPFTQAWTDNSDAVFGDNGTFSFLRLVNSSGTAQLGNVTTGTNTTISFGADSNVQKIEFGGATKTFTIGLGSVANFGAMTLQDSGVTANGIIKAGAGTLVMGGGTYTGGFTLNAGNVVAKTNSLFSTGSVTIAGGAIGTTLSTFTPVITTGGRSKIDVTGDFQIGLSGNVGGNDAAANYTFTTAGNGFDLNGSTRKITIGTSGTVTLGRAITNGRLTLARIDGGTGTFVLSASNSLLGTELQDVSVNAQTSNFVFGTTGTVTLSGTNATSLSLISRTLANNFTIADSAGTKTIAQSGAANAVISGTITNSDTQGGLTLGAVAGKQLTVGEIIGAGSRGISFGSSTLSGTVTLSRATSYAGDTRIDSSTLLTLFGPRPERHHPDGQRSRRLRPGWHDPVDVGHPEHPDRR